MYNFFLIQGEKHKTYLGNCVGTHDLENGGALIHSGGAISVFFSFSFYFFCDIFPLVGDLDPH